MKHDALIIIASHLIIEKPVIPLIRRCMPDWRIGLAITGAAISSNNYPYIPVRGVRQQIGRLEHRGVHNMEFAINRRIKAAIYDTVMRKSYLIGNLVIGGCDAWMGLAARKILFRT